MPPPAAAMPPPNAAGLEGEVLFTELKLTVVLFNVTVPPFILARPPPLAPAVLFVIYELFIVNEAFEDVTDTPPPSFPVLSLTVTEFNVTFADESISTPLPPPFAPPP